MIEAAVSILGTAVLGVFGWAYTISNRVTAVETEYDGLKDLIKTQFKGVNDRLDRIEDKL